MKLEKTSIKDVCILTPEVYLDERGFFMESYNALKLLNQNEDIRFLQDNHSYSRKRGTLRGIHFQQEPFAQNKIVRCTRGKIFDVAVDLRKDSKTYKQYVSVILSADNFRQLFIPKGFGHAFLTLTDDVEVQYKVDTYYSKVHESSILYCDPELNITWPEMTYILSDKDRKAPLLKNIENN